MKRGGWLARVTPLRSRSRSRLTRSSAPRSVRTVTPEERRARALVRERSGGACELCARPATDWSHRKRRSQGGLWCPSNGLHLCRADHSRVDNSCDPVPVFSGWHVPSWGDPETTPVYLPRHGWVLLRPDGGLTPCDPPTSDPDGAA